MVNANPKISIIVPVYKAERYLHRCIDSILSQTFTDWELLLIDDGSPDRSGEICDEYAVKENRIRVFHKENGGVSSARNLGLEIMRGEYVTFVDADDCLYVDALEVFMAHVVKYDLDFAQCGFNRVYDDRNRGQDRCPDVLTAEEYIKKKFLSVCVGGGVFKSSIVREGKLQFDKMVRLGEDQIFIYNYLLRSKRNQYINKILYFYRDNGESAVHNPKGEYVIESIKAFSILKSQNHLAYNQCNKMFIEYFITLSMLNDVSVKEIYAIFKSINIENCDFATAKGKVIYYLSKFSIPFTVVIIRLFKKVLTHK